MSELGACLGLLWPIIGIVWHICRCCQMKTWCGTPIWEEWSTYMMFFPAMIIGPLFFIIDLLEPIEPRKKK